MHVEHENVNDLVSGCRQWRNYGPAGPAAAGGPGKRGGPFFEGAKNTTILLSLF